MNLSLIKIAQENIKISKNKYYSNNKEEKINLIQDKNHPFFLKENIEVKTITKTQNAEDLKTFKNTTVQVDKVGTVDTLLELSKEKDCRCIGVLNFASAKHPGGGFLTGAVAQEECLCYCSDLYSKQLGQEYYEINKNNKSKFYTDSMIISQTNFIRSSDYKLLDKPVHCLVITCPAVNQKIAGNTPESKLVMKNRMRKILEMFIYYQQTNIILGAYGCGVFGNDAKTIATDWYDLLYKEDYIKYFEHINFSILGNKNFTPFKEVFKA